MNQKLLGLFILMASFIAGNASAQCTANIYSFSNANCVGDTIVIHSQPSGQPNYQWHLNGNPIGGNDSVLYYVMTTPGTLVFSVDVTNTNNCTATSNLATFNANITPTVSVSNNGPLCSGSTLQLSSTGTNITSYQWYGPGGFSSTQANPSISNAQPANSGYYSLMAYNGGCAAYATTQAIISSNNPSLQAYALNSGMCSGDTLQFATMINGITGITYSWTGPNSFTSTSANPFISNAQPIHSGTYTLTITGTACTGSVTLTDTANVNVGAMPAVSAANNGPVCAGQTLQFTGSVSTGTYWWTGPNAFYSTQLSPSISNVQTTDAGVYTLHVSNGGCYTSVQTTVVVNPNTPTLNALCSSAGCIGDTLQLWSNVTGLTGVTYSWTGPNGFTSTLPYPSITNAQSINAGVYTLTVTGTGCSGSVTLTDTANATLNAVPTVTVSNNGPLCWGSTLQLTSTGTNITSYQWYGPAGFNSTQANPAINNVTTANGGVYSLFAYNGGCSAYASTSVSVSNGYAAASAFIWSNTICEGDSIWLHGSSTGFTSPGYSWSGPNGFTSNQQDPQILSSQLTNTGVYILAVTGTACGGTVTLYDTLNVTVVPCDSVWPGDANSDFMAWYSDILHLGVLYGQTGPTRPGATINWTAQYCTDWGNTVGVDNKHADCNGDGVIDANDTAAVVANYGSIHNRGIHVSQAKSTAFPDLYFDMTGIGLEAGASVTIPVKLGTGTLAMNNIYGIGAELHVQGITPVSPIAISGNSSWIGNGNVAIDFNKSVSNNQTDWAFVRTDHSNISGDGTIGFVTLNVPAGTEYQQVDIYLDNVIIIDKDGNVITDYNVVDAGATVFPLSVNTAQIVNSISVVPNPSDAQASLQISLAKGASIQIIVTDITGRNVWSTQHNATAGAQNISLPANQLAPGMYTIQVRDDKGAISQTLKWTRK